MKGASFATRVALSVAAGLLLTAATIDRARADEIKVLTSVALTSALDELKPQFEKATGHKLTIGYALIAEVRKRVLDGETADVLILSRPVMEELQKQGKLTPDAITNIAGTAVALVVRAGAPKPDISTVDALKKTLLDAKSIAYSDPAKGGASGVYFAKVLDRIGIADQVKAKTILVAGALAPEVVAKGEAEIGCAQTSEIVPVAGTQLVGGLPGELASITLFAGALMPGSKAPDAAKSLIQFLTGPAAAPLLKAKGFQPG